MSHGWAETGYGTVILTDSAPTAADYVDTFYWGAHIGGWAEGFYNITATSSNDNVVRVNAYEGTDPATGHPCIVVEFTKGTQEGVASIEVDYTVTQLTNEVNIAVGSDSASAVSGCLRYNVGNGVGDVVSGEDVVDCYTVEINLAQSATEGHWWQDYYVPDFDQFGDFHMAKRWDKGYLNAPGIAYYWIGTSNGRTYWAKDTQNHKVMVTDPTVAIAEVTPYADDEDAGSIIKLTGLKPGKTEIYVTAEMFFDMLGSTYLTDFTYRIHLTVTDSNETRRPITLTYHDWNDSDVELTGVVGGYAGDTFTINSQMQNKSGYTFKGWAETQDGTTVKWEAGKEYTFTQDTHLYAVWEKAPDKTYTVTYTDGVEGQTVFPDQGYEGLKEGEDTPAFDPSDPTSYTDGAGNTYTFMGWNPAVNPVVSADDADENGNIVYTATWQKDAPALKDLTVSKTSSEKYPVVGEEFTYTITVHNPNSKAIIVKITDELNEKLDVVWDDEYEMYGVSDSGVYNKDTHTVTWNNVEVPANGDKKVTVTVKANATGDIYNEAKIECEVNEASGNTTVTAKEPAPVPTTYTVYHEYYTDGQRDGSTTDSPVNGTVGQVVKVEDIEKVLKYTKNGVENTYTYTQANKGIAANSPDGYTLGEVITQLTLAESGNIIVLRYDRTTAKDIPYTVIYAAYDGEKDEVGNLPERETKMGTAPGSVDFTVSSQVPTREGYTFAGWYNAETYNGGDTLTLKATAEADSVTVTLYAKWTKNPDQYTVTYSWSGLPEGHTETLPTGGMYAEGTEVTVNTSYPQGKEVTVGGVTYVFSGWSTKDATITGGKFTMPAKNVEITGTWSVKTPDKPTDEVLKDIELGVQIVCDVQGSGHAATGYTLTNGAKTIGDVTANTGANKDQYPYTCTVSISTTQQNDYWLTQGMQGGAPKWNEDHKLLDNAQNLSVTLYWNGSAWVDLDALASGWHYMVIHTTHKPTDPVDPVKPAPVIKVEKTNDGLKLDENSGTLKVNYTVKITNKSGYDIVGLRLTDVMDEPTLKKVNDTDVGEPSVKLTFSNWKVQTTEGGNFEDAKLISGGENELTHVLQLLPRDETYEDEQTVTLTYTVEVESLNDEVAVKVKLDNEAEGASWINAPATQNLGRAIANALFRAAIMPFADDDEPDVTGKDDSSATTDPDAPDVTGKDNSTTGGTTEGGGSETEGVIPRKWTVSYSWTGLPEEATEEVPDSAKYLAGKPVTVDSREEGDTVTVGGETYKFSGWTVPVTVTDGEFTMPERDVVITGTWTKAEPEKPTQEPSQEPSQTPDIPIVPDIVVTPTPGVEPSQEPTPSAEPSQEPTPSQEPDPVESEQPSAPVESEQPDEEPSEQPSEDPGEDIDDPDTPLGELPEDPADSEEPGDPDEDLGDNDTPTGELPGDSGNEENPAKPEDPTQDGDESGEDIDDGMPPMGDVPQTGDNLGVWIAAAAVSGAGLMGIVGTTRKRKEDEEA